MTRQIRKRRTNRLGSAGPKAGSNKGDAMLVGLFVAVVGFMTGYIFAEADLVQFIHPLHWLAALASAALGYLAGLVLYAFRARRRG